MTQAHLKNFCQFEFPMDNLDIINNGNCRLCPFVQEPSYINDVKVLQTHYETSHKVKLIQHANNPEMSTVIQEENSLDPNTKFVIIGIYEVGKCIQQDCWYAKKDKKSLKANNLQVPALKVLQTGKNLKFWKADHGLKEDDFKVHPSFACIFHALKSDKASRAGGNETTLLQRLFYTYGQMYSFDLELRASNKLKLSVLHPVLRFTLKNRETVEATKTQVETVLHEVVTPQIQEQTKLITDGLNENKDLLNKNKEMLNILVSNNLWAVRMMAYFEKMGYTIEIVDEGKHVTIAKGDLIYSSITKIETRKVTKDGKTYDSKKNEITQEQLMDRQTTKMAQKQPMKQTISVEKHSQDHLMNLQTTKTPKMTKNPGLSTSGFLTEHPGPSTSGCQKKHVFAKERKPSVDYEAIEVASNLENVIEDEPLIAPVTYFYPPEPKKSRSKFLGNEENTSYKICKTCNKVCVNRKQLTIHNEKFHTNFSTLKKFNQSFFL